MDADARKKIKRIAPMDSRKAGARGKIVTDEALQKS